jgi:cytochrome c-type biogenesis protein CcmH
MPESLPKAIVAVLFALLAAAVQAKEALPEADDPALEARMTRITAELRCLVCQNQTIADSNAGLAVDLRRETRDMLRQGKSDAEIIAYMTARYGDFVLYRPPLKATTALLWFGPAAMLALGAAVLVLVLRRRTKLAADAFEPDLDADGGDTEAVEAAADTAAAAAATRP